ncbi:MULTISPECIES: NAD(+) diphosphatase [Atlantibacter]|jgi:NAD+ diphosphatase|uniref:NAD(+) diphosphatase n=1 Tax=Atlantibacter TaxID=1903434 RepID=UPI00124BCD33|nr:MULTISPECIES: NAD(+) diphosphatase [Atlantibacter]MDW2745187.1 NAD(+) diphosphatase [Atlantibacter subterranea]QFH69443.1 NAD(+) diphosphatase [Enterobacter sp. E76]
MERLLQKIDHGWWIVSHEQKLWLPKGELPHGNAENFGLTGQMAAQIGEWQGEPVWLVRQAKRQDMGSVRQVIDQDVGLFQLAGRGVQLAEFYRAHKFCGYCGHEMHPSKTEWAMLCHHCRQRYYPQISPCIIVAIRHQDKILLAQHTRHRNGLYTVLAGFVEVGETLEQAVAREVMEESGITVKNLRYVTSQPWPFPQSLMTAFMAEYHSGELKIDPKELLDAGWYRFDDLPLLPPPGTVARRLIEDTVALCRAEYGS